MKRRVNTLASSTAKKKSHWREEADDEEADFASGAPPLPDSDEEKPPIPQAPPTSRPTTGAPNPVVWMDIVVADKSRGRLHFELFQDLSPKVCESFRNLCVGHSTDSKTVSYADTAIDLVFGGRYLTAGDIDASLDFEGVERNSDLKHAKAGLLTMPFGSASFFDPRFQITLGVVPELDGKQLIFGQLLATPGCGLHPLHWVEVMGTANGTPREGIVIKACGECSAEECQVLLGAMVMAAQVDRTLESQIDRFGRTGHTHGELEDAVTHENLTQVLELTEDLLGHLEWACKKNMGSERDRKAGVFEAQLKSLMKALKKVEFKAGDIKGYENRLALDAKSQLGRAKDLEESLVRVY